jgi:hypothetical protein
LPDKENTLQAQYTDGHVVVYQAYNAKIASWAVKGQCFGGPDFSFNKVSWIKPNFTWMKYRCGWAEQDPNQECVLAIRLKWSFGMRFYLVQFLQITPRWQMKSV